MTEELKKQQQYLKRRIEHYMQVMVQRKDTFSVLKGLERELQKIEEEIKKGS